MTNYNFGDVVLIGFPHTDYSKISKRPTLIIYDGGDQDILLARITSQKYSSKADYIILDRIKAGLITDSYVRLGKMATIEKSYVIKKLGRMPENEILSIKSILKEIFSL